MARSMGWFRYTGDLWMRNVVGEVSTSSDEMEDPNLFRLAICCMD